MREFRLTVLPVLWSVSVLVFPLLVLGAWGDVITGFVFWSSGALVAYLLRPAPPAAVAASSAGRWSRRARWSWLGVLALDAVLIAAHSWVPDARRAALSQAAGMVALVNLLMVPTLVVCEVRMLLRMGAHDREHRAHAG